MRLTGRDRQIIEAVYTYRVLSREQIQRSFCPSQRTANRVLSRLYHHGFLERRFLPTEFGQGYNQALYLLGERGADLLAATSGEDRDAILWTPEHNEIGPLFLEHTLAVNDVRIAVTLAAAQKGFALTDWIDEPTLKSQEMKDYVMAVWKDSRGETRKRRIAVVPDGYFVITLGGKKKAHFFLEVDRATEANRRFADKVRAYLAYTESGKYQERYQTRSLRILTVTTGEKRLQNLKETTEAAGGKNLFWFTTAELATPDRVLTAPIWQVASQKGRQPLLG